ncbi:AgmX/PglI C-terminal domain-containing protein [Enhygromyxa salina]|uniref:Vault protein inter-alpha-trypsin n=1 Tax=Enhygromyxa salina TaxID=215803 RepID=A0A2S9YW44_9BACT|nr:AgmX/PglI C-terminal domain-containing protein [Enhygromyxa salina]PRQ09325.1 Vault protein inter-alpha-trypsin [Enhygromyxa salina]
MRSSVWLPWFEVFMLSGLLVACAPKGQPDPKPREEPAEVPAELAFTSSDLDPRALPAVSAQTKEAPLSLTASDGTGLELVSLTARAVVQEPLAFTELHLVFDNPEARTIEGHFQIDLPPDASISRFAMKIDSHWQEGEVVERQAARRAYEDFLHRKQDPALLEKQAGNRFAARVFPIPANARKELIISYSQELGDSREPYRMVLEGLPKLEELDVEIVIDRPSGAAATSLGGESSSHEKIVVHKTDFVPDKNLEVASTRPAAAVGIRHDQLVLARVAAVGDLPPDPIDELTILFDTSASRALGFAGQLHRLHALVGQLRANHEFRLRVMSFDQDLALVYDGPASGFGSKQLETIYAGRAMGASDLTHALERLAEVGGTKRVLLVSDGIATAGETELGALQTAVRALGEAGVERLDAVIDGGLQDRDVLAGMTTAGLARDGVVLDARTPTTSLASRLAQATASGITVTVPGAEWSWPTKLDGVQPGDEVLVYAKLPKDMGMRVRLDGGAHSLEAPVELTTVSKPLLERAWVGARIDATTVQRSQLGDSPSDKLLRDELQREIVRLSTTHRVVSEFTALLVLETEQDYARFEIDRKALADILTVGDVGGNVGVVASHRDELWLADQQAEQAENEAELENWDDEASEEDGGGQGQRHRGEEGQMGRPGGTDSRLFSMRGPSAAMEAPMEEKAAPDDDQWAELEGSEIGEAYGVGGLGLVGTGRGGGGTGEGTIGLGNTGLIGRGGGGGSGSGYGRGSGAGFGGRGARVPIVRQAAAEVLGSLDRDIVRRIVRAHINEVRSCYNAGLSRDPSLQGRVAINFVIDDMGSVSSSSVDQASTLTDRTVSRCIASAVERWRFPKPRGGGVVRVTYPFILSPGDGEAPNDDEPPPPPQTPEELEQRRIAAEAAERERLRLAAEADEAKRYEDSPYSGKLFDVMALISAGKHEAALSAALAWSDESPGDVLALLAVGEALEALGRPRAAARAYGSIIDLFPARADLRRYAGARLERLGEAGMQLAADTYAQAVAQRPDHPASHRLHAYALLRQGQLEPALAAIEAGATRDYPSGRFDGVDRILDEDLGLIASALIKAEPLRKAEIEARVRAAGGVMPSGRTLRFVMTWETDANDVDFHIHDGRGGHAYYSDRTLPSGGLLYADVTTGYGPECFTISGKPSAFPYRFEANYYSRGPMGYGMGKLQIVQSDGLGDLRFEDRVYVIMKDGAFVDLGTLDQPLQPGHQ